MYCWLDLKLAMAFDLRVAVEVEVGGLVDENVEARAVGKDLGSARAALAVTRLLFLISNSMTFQIINVSHDEYAVLVRFLC